MTADLKELAKSIAASENPYAEFDKHASEMDETHTATLSRELNKQMFLQNLHNADLNNDINFGMIESGADHGATNEEGTGTIKVASIKEDRSHLVTDDMFLLSRDENKMVKMAAQGTDLMFDQQLEFDNLKLVENQNIALLEKKAEDRNRALREYNELEYLVIDTLVKQASHEGDLRAYMSVMINEDKTDLIEPLIMSSNYSMSDIEKTASEELSTEDKQALSIVFGGMKSIDDAFSSHNEDSWTEEDTIEKIAMLSTLISAGSKIGGSILKGVGKVVGTVGKPASDGLGLAARKIGGKVISGTGNAILGTGGFALGTGKAIMRNRKLSLGAAGVGLMSADLLSKTEVNRQKIVDGLM